MSLYQEKILHDWLHEKKAVITIASSKHKKVEQAKAACGSSETREQESRTWGGKGWPEALPHCPEDSGPSVKAQTEMPIEQAAEVRELSCCSSLREEERCRRLRREHSRVRLYLTRKGKEREGLQIKDFQNLLGHLKNDHKTHLSPPTE